MAGRNFQTIWGDFLNVYTQQVDLTPPGLHPTPPLKPPPQPKGDMVGYRTNLTGTM